MAGRCRTVRVRIAPSPTGAPHVGTAYIALFNYAFARSTGGRFILRIEDTDRERSTPESEAGILEALRWVGLNWDEGPDVGGPFGPYRQSERSDIYRRYAEELLESGNAYRCFCTAERLAELRKTQQARGVAGGCDGLCRTLSEEESRQKLSDGTPHTIRLKVPRDGETSYEDLVRGKVVFRNVEIDDQILLKSDGFPTYHLANVVDDHLMEITHVCRAEEWITSTPKHVLLYQAFGWQMPTFVHMPLLRNRDKSKISKRKDPTSLLWYRCEGFLPEALLNFLALMGWSFGEDREVFSLAEMIDIFTWDRLRASGPVFDLQKLEWLNGEYIRLMTPEELLEKVLSGHYTTHADQPAEKLLPVVALVQERLKRLAEFDELAGFFFAREDYPAEDLIPKKGDAALAREVLGEFKRVLDGIVEWEAARMEAAARALCEQKDWKRRDAYMPLRVAVTCRKVSTPLFETMAALGQRECMERLQEAIEKVRALD